MSATFTPAPWRSRANSTPSRRGRDSRTKASWRSPFWWAAPRHSNTFVLRLSVRIVAGRSRSFTKLRPAFRRPSSSSRCIASRNPGHFAGVSRRTFAAMRATLRTLPIAGWASSSRRASSWTAARSVSPDATRRSNAGRFRAARWVAPLWWSPATAATFSSTDSGSMLHPLVVHSEAVDAVPDPAAQEVVGVRLRALAGEPEEFLGHSVLPALREGSVDELAPGGILDQLPLDRLPGAVVRAEVAEEERARFQLEEAAERREVVFEVEGGCGGDRDQDLVRREIEARGVPRVHGPVLLVEHGELMGRVARGVEEPEDAPAKVEGLAVLDGMEAIGRDRCHRP